MPHKTTDAWLRGGAGPMKDRRLKRTSRGNDDAAAIDEQMESVQETLTTGGVPPMIGADTSPIYLDDDGRAVLKLCEIPGCPVCESEEEDE